MAEARTAGNGQIDLEVTFRAAQLDEAELLTDLALRSKTHWGYDLDFLEWNERDATIEAVGQAIGETYIAERGNRIVGFYGLKGYSPDLVLDFMFVAPSAIGSGIGRIMFDHAVIAAKRLGAKKMEIESYPHAEGFYLAMGAKRVGARMIECVPGRILPLLEMTL